MAPEVTAPQAMDQIAVVKLTETNYEVWKHQILAAIHGHGLEKFIDGTNPPQQFLSTDESGNSNPNPQYSHWIRQDQLIVSWFLSSLSDSMLVATVGLNTAFEIWKSLEAHFSSQSKAKVLQFKEHLPNCDKSSTQSMRDYLNKIKRACDEYLAAGYKLSIADQVQYILGGLGPEYMSVVAALCSKPESVSIMEVTSLLLDFESRLERLGKVKVNRDGSIPSVNFASQNSGFRGGYNSRGGWTNRGGRFSRGGRASNASFGGIQNGPWFGSRYVVDIPVHLMDQWENPSEIDPSLHLPSKNDFIPRDFTIYSDKASSQVEDASYPRCILNEPYMKLWYKLDRTFKVPRANTYFRMTLKGACNNIRNALLSELFILLLKDELDEITFQARVANLETSVSLYGDKLELRLYGFNDKLSFLLSKILAIAKTFLPKDDRFKVIKEELGRTLRNTNMKPLSHSSYLRLQVLCQSFWDVDEKLSLLNDLSLSDLSAFVPDLLSQLYIEGICHGNMLESEALQISDMFKSNFSVQPLPLELRHKEFVMRLPPSANIARDVRVKNKRETNSVLELYFQIEPEEGTKLIKLKALTELFDEIVKEPLFKQLRTKEQLGCVVDCSQQVTYRILGFCFRVQSSEYNPVYLQGRIDNFINSLDELLNGLDQESFEDYRNGLMGKLREKDPSLLYETNRFWGQIVDKRYMFDMSKEVADELKDIKKEDVVDWYGSYLRQPSPKCRRLAIRVWGCNTDWNDAGAVVESEEVIENLEGLKKSAQFYPSFC